MHHTQCIWTRVTYYISTSVHQQKNHQQIYILLFQIQREAKVVDNELYFMILGRLFFAYRFQKIERLLNIIANQLLVLDSVTGMSPYPIDIVKVSYLLLYSLVEVGSFNHFISLRFLEYHAMVKKNTKSGRMKKPTKYF